MGELKLVDITCWARGTERASGDRGGLPLQVQLWTGRDDVPLEGVRSARGVLEGSSTLQSSAVFSLFRVCLWI